MSKDTKSFIVGLFAVIGAICVVVLLFFMMALGVCSG